MRSPDDIKQLIEERDNIRQTNPADPRLTELQTDIKHKKMDTEEMSGERK